MTNPSLLSNIRSFLSTFSLTPPPPMALPPWTTHTANLALLYALKPHLPPELILLILAHPSRHIVQHTALAAPHRGGHNGEVIILATPPLSVRSDRVRSLVFTFRSRDQGGSWDREWHMTWAHSWTWFEAGVRRWRRKGAGRESGALETRTGPVEAAAAAHPEAAADTEAEIEVEMEIEALPRWEIQRNRHAGREYEDYRIEIGPEHPLWGELREGDEIVLWACQRYPGWSNRVESAGIEVSWVDDVEDGE